MEKQLVFPEAKKVAIEEYAPSQPGPGQVAVRSHYSLISTGTELTIYNQSFDPGTAWARYGTLPFYPGYALAGTVEAVGEGVTTVQAGDRVALRKKHASFHVVAVEDCSPVPANVDMKSAPWFALAKIAFVGAYQAGHRLGDAVTVIGAGPIGQMSVRWACAAGAETVVAIDPVSLRLEMALRGGATRGVSTGVEEYWKEMEKRPQEEWPSIIIDTTGNASVFAFALKMAPDNGRVVLLGNPGNPGDQRLSQDIMRKGLTIVGAHDRMSPGGWNSRSIPRLFFHLASKERFNLDGLNTHEFKPEDCAKAYEIANTRRGETMGILFDWRNA